MKVTESIKSFLELRQTEMNADLIERIISHWPDLELQVNVLPSDGELVPGKRSTWSNGVDTWHSLRIPRNAGTDPVFNDYEIRYPLDIYCEGIGFTGWDWRNKKSLWVAFDVDALTSHAAGVGISDEALQAVKDAAFALPYVEVRRSTGGSGWHLYVYLSDVTTQNHTEHSALARCILGIMSSECNFDFASHVDCCGSIMWVYHRKTTAENRGLEVIKSASKVLTIDDLPSNWRDHVDVITKQRTKIRINSITDDAQDPFETLASSRKIIPLDESHKSQIEELQSSGYTTLWIPDHHLLQTHTKALEELMEIKSLKLIGYFKTNSQGNHPDTPNCFLFPLLNGAWRVFRFSPGITEAETWTQDGDGWTTCYFNRKPNLKTAALISNGIEDPDGGFVFSSAEDAIKAAKLLGQTLKLDKELAERQINLKTHKDGRLVINIEKKKDDKPVDGWLDKKKKWTRIFETKTEPEDEEADEFDSLIRAVTTPAEKFAFWATHAKSKWPEHPSQNIKMLLQALGNSKTEAEEIMGRSIEKAWELVTLPFQDEYPGNRRWNRRAAQLRYKPADLDGEEPFHPHWDMIYDHVGQELTTALQELEWAQDAGIKTGADYLRAWTACVLRHPFEQLPYLFLHGPEESGKSTFWESLDVLITRGVVKADKALVSAGDFNGELDGAIICAVEERDLSKHPGAAAKIRDASTGKTLSIRRMRTDAYEVPNTTHWIQTGNKLNMCPIPVGDTRVTVCFVPRPPEEVPKELLYKKLHEEAPHFMYTLMTMQLPPILKRLRLPVVTTNSKLQSQDSNCETLTKFVNENCVAKVGAKLFLADLYNRFIATIEVEDKVLWPKSRVVQDFPTQYKYVDGRSNIKYWEGLVLK